MSPESPAREQPSLRRWLLANTLTPAWLARYSSHPLAGYGLAVVAAAAAAAAAVLLDRVLPGFLFPGLLPLGAVALVALAVGAGPSLLSSLLGALLTTAFFGWSGSGGLLLSGETASFVLFLVLGALISLSAGRTERARRQAEALAEGLSRERAELTAERTRLEQVIAALHLAETQLGARVGQLEATFEAIADGVFVFSEGGAIQEMNRAGRTMFRLEAPPPVYAAPLKQRGYESAVRDEDGQLVAEWDWPLFRILQGEVITGPGAVELRVESADGRQLEVSVTGAPVRDASGVIVGAVCIVRDVTERRRLERRTSEALHALLQMAEALVLRHDGDGQTTRAVAQRLVELTCSVLGCRRVAISALDPGSGLMEPVAAVGLSPHQEEQWRQGGPQGRLGERLGGADVGARLQQGEVLVLEATDTALTGGPNPYGLETFLLAPMLVGGQLMGVLSLDHGGTRHAYNDGERALAGVAARLAGLVIERERLLRERAEAQAAELALREANERMDEFMNIASHELKTPLTTLKVVAQLTQARLHKVQPGDLGVADAETWFASLSSLLGRMDRQIARMERLISDLLDISRIQSGRLALRLVPIDLATVVREAVDEQREVWPERTIALDIESGGPFQVKGDPERLAQVMANFLTNALKYSAADCPVSVMVHHLDGTARVSVRDQGPGIPAAEQPRIWERFYRVPGVEPRSGSGLGLGLGLYITRTIVERHGGEVGVDGEVGDGSTFRFTLPLYQQDTPSAPGV